MTTKLSTALWAVAGLVVLDLIVLQFNLFNRIESVDVPMHILGGLVAGIGFAWFYQKMRLQVEPKWFKFCVVVSLVLAAGAVFELIEFGILSPLIGTKSYWTDMTVRDTLGDLFNDSVGGIIAWYFFIKNS